MAEQDRSNKFFDYLRQRRTAIGIIAGGLALTACSSSGSPESPNTTSARPSASKTASSSAPTPATSPSKTKEAPTFRSPIPIDIAKDIYMANATKSNGSAIIVAAVEKPEMLAKIGACRPELEAATEVNLGFANYVQEYIDSGKLDGAQDVKAQAEDSRDFAFATASIYEHIVATGKTDDMPCGDGSFANKTISSGGAKLQAQLFPYSPSPISVSLAGLAAKNVCSPADVAKQWKKLTPSYEGFAGSSDALTALLGSVTLKSGKQSVKIMSELLKQQGDIC